MIVGVCRLIANHLHLAFFESTPEVRAFPPPALPSFIGRDTVRLPPMPPPRSDVEAATLAPHGCRQRRAWSQSLRALPALYVFIVNRTTTKATCRRPASSSGVIQLCHYRKMKVSMKKNVGDEPSSPRETLM
jgi:hypothetical protein